MPTTPLRSTLVNRKRTFGAEDDKKDALLNDFISAPIIKRRCTTPPLSIESQKAEMISQHKRIVTETRDIEYNTGSSTINYSPMINPVQMLESQYQSHQLLTYSKFATSKTQEQQQNPTKLYEDYERSLHAAYKSASMKASTDIDMEVDPSPINVNEVQKTMEETSLMLPSQVCNFIHPVHLTQRLQREEAVARRTQPWNNIIWRNDIY